MVVVPAGEFMMGSHLREAQLREDDKAYDDEIAPGRGKRLMRIPRRFAIGRYPVTFEEYDVYCKVSPSKRISEDAGWGRGRLPVINASWHDAQDYAYWLNERLGATYRLPSEAEWEYACRAGTDTRRWWGESWDGTRANGGRSFEDGRTSPVDHFPADPWGLCDMLGNAWEWCADEWVDNIAELPNDGVAFDSSKLLNYKRKHVGNRARRGGSWNGAPRRLRVAHRNWSASHNRGVMSAFVSAGRFDRRAARSWRRSADREAGRSPPRSSRGVGGGLSAERPETSAERRRPAPQRGGEGNAATRPRLDQPDAPHYDRKRRSRRIMTITVNIGEAKARLSELIARAEAGEEIVIARDNAPVALLSRLPRADDIRAAIEEIRDARAGLPATTVEEILQWRDEGRRF